MTHSKSSRRAALAIAGLLAVALSALTHQTTASAGEMDGIIQVKCAFNLTRNADVGAHFVAPAACGM